MKSYKRTIDKQIKNNPVTLKEFNKVQKTNKSKQRKQSKPLEV